MAKLQMLQPRVQMAQGPKLKTLSGTWRTSGMGGTERGYGYKWQKAREQFLREHPICCMCWAEGRVTVATIVDHITPHRGNQDLFWDESNWQSLCTKHHSSDKQREEAKG